MSTSIVLFLLAVLCTIGNANGKITPALVQRLTRMDRISVIIIIIIIVNIIIISGRLPVSRSVACLRLRLTASN